MMSQLAALAAVNNAGNVVSSVASGIVLVVVLWFLIVIALAIVLLRFFITLPTRLKDIDFTLAQIQKSIDNLNNTVVRKQFTQNHSDNNKDNN